METRVSPFLAPGSVTTAGRLALIHLKIDHKVPTILQAQDDNNEGYEEGKVINTQFGSFPHSTLIGLPWGSQVRASKVDTGSRGRRGPVEKKRKRDEDSEALDSEQREGTPINAKEAVAAPTGFIHVLPPTPENWTSSLPHRTQVVYTPDYSYILQRIRARPGTRIIEAGAGSGSFTHASARAVYSGYPSSIHTGKKRKLGKVWSYEFHEQRHGKLVKEIQDHGLEGVVETTHRDVCKDGFLLGSNLDESPAAEAIFLDLPAPWLALPHLTRKPPPSRLTLHPSDSKTPSEESSQDSPAEDSKPFVSALNANSAVHLCTFSPCIEQVQRTISVMRQLGWIDISMVEIAHKRMEIRRERIGIANGLERGVQATAANVEEAVTRLREVEGRLRNFHGEEEDEEGEKKNVVEKTFPKTNPNSKEKVIESLVGRKMYKEGRLIHRSEGELKTHTSYLVFAVLPQEWTEEDEAKARGKWPVKQKSVVENGSKVNGGRISKRQQKRDARQAQKDRAQEETKEEGDKQEEAEDEDEKDI